MYCVGGMGGFGCGFKRLYLYYKNVGGLRNLYNKLFNESDLILVYLEECVIEGLSIFV